MSTKFVLYPDNGHDYNNVFCNHAVMAQHAFLKTNTKPRAPITVDVVEKKEGIPLPWSAGQKHQYTCMATDNTTCILFTYESYSFINANNKLQKLSRFMHPSDLNAFKFNTFI